MTDFADETTGARIRRLREARGWSQQDLAVAAGLTTGRVYLIEKGANMKVATLRAFAAALDVPAAALLVDEPAAS